MKKSDALKQQRHAKNQEQLALIERAKVENRDFNDAEATEFDTRKAEMDALDKQIERQLEIEAVEERAARANATNVAGAGASTSEQRELEGIQKRFSIAKALREANPKSGAALSGVEKEVNEIGIAESRAAGVAVPGDTNFSLPMSMLRATQQTVTQDSGAYGGALVQNQAPRMVEPLRPRLVFEDLGATFLTGLTGGNIPLVVGNDFAMEFLAEGASITPQKKTFAGPTLSPKRAGGAVDISNQLLLQSSLDVEAMIMNGLINGFRQLLHSACINGAGGVAPTGLLSVVGVNASAQIASGAATWASVVELQALIEEDNATEQSLGYLLHPKLKAALKQIKKDAGSGRFLYEEGLIDGVQAIATSLVPVLDASGTAVYPLIYGDFSQMTIGQWGAVNVSINPYSADLADSVRLVLNTHADMQVANPKAFAKNALLTA
jgi:HK97 family phage major capsid protein